MKRINFKALNRVKNEAFRKGDYTLAEEIERTILYAEQSPEEFLKEYPIYDLTRHPNW